jgi:hypothetical protein
MGSLGIGGTTIACRSRSRRPPPLRKGRHLASGWVEHVVCPCSHGFKDDKAATLCFVTRHGATSARALYAGAIPQPLNAGIGNGQWTRVRARGTSP